MRAITRALYLLAGVLALAGLGLRLVPARPAVPAADPIAIDRPATEPSPSERAQALLTFQEIVQANVFSQDRAAPAQRYVPPELALPEPVPTAAPAAAPRLRLFGVAVGPTGAVALIDADPAIPGAEVYRQGDLVRGLQLVEIRETTVVLMGEDGPTVLSLPSSGRRSQ
ncbi:MAG: hypothetical protein GWN99_02275 [Gemmatimonadetes bacterium]|uniref:Type II secretion system protein GspC N-terminal domain-containing protein n=1 Tax=Candidatus Kutchimonas denitrificans TaxID=3056748 RepID=A0AAE4Z618_9BACT|nr:hypothetical protein [Gemmatimonadota bacterium]NIR74480.1 hypothetical protein [Candidatus Kutchimonas denitrificans]NIR99892.1 hypothetical protein [Gemmatimonadota bacterium]NIT66718.1 hypothetical protein [Gemmatimonadota bacterium]NIU52130.1 hypothetical protein [Gemmatimonadota bacterium]